MKLTEKQRDQIFEAAASVSYYDTVKGWAALPLYALDLILYPSSDETKRANSAKRKSAALDLNGGTHDGKETHQI